MRLSLHVDIIKLKQGNWMLRVCPFGLHDGKPFARVDFLFFAVRITFDISDAP